jgi:hypothetical protein
MGLYDYTRARPGVPVRGRLHELVLADEAIDFLATALWDLAALHKTYPRPHVERLHALRRYLLAVQVAGGGDLAWETALPAPPSEST